MSTPRWRWSVIGVWVSLLCMSLLAVDGMTARSWLLVAVAGVIPPVMLLSLWPEVRPLPVRSLHLRRKL